MTDRYTGPIIDAHHHLWDLSLGRHPWITDADSPIKALGDVAFLRHDYMPADFVADIGPQNVAGTVYVEAAWDRSRPAEEEVLWVEALTRPPGMAARLVSWTDLRSPDAGRVLDGLAAHPSVVGIRETIRWHPDPAKRWSESGILADPAWRRGFDELCRRNLSLELLMNPYQSDEVAALAAETPDQLFIVNHCGTPVDRDAEGLERWRRGLVLMGKQPNVQIKVSNYGAYGPDRSLDSLRRTVMTCIEAFGPRRSMFGSDYPVGRRSMPYQDMCERFKDIVRDFSAAEQRDLFHDNAARTYRFEA